MKFVPKIKTFNCSYRDYDLVALSGILSKTFGFTDMDTNRGSCWFCLFFIIKDANYKKFGNHGEKT